MEDTRTVETELPEGPSLQGRDLLSDWTAELEHRIELLEEDITLLFKAAGLAGLREQELLKKLGLPDDTLQRHQGELLSQIAVPAEE